VTLVYYCLTTTLGDPYLLAARKLDVERALVVEDSDAGERSGRAAGCDVVRVYGAREVAAKVRAALG
jgi:beta-phosphoglucomutase-like phosphatase (HAD superfamily)